MEQVTISGIKELNEQEIGLINKLSNEYLQKISKQLKNEVSFNININTSHKKGRQKLFNLKLRVTAPTRAFESSYSDWDFAKTLHKVFNSILAEIKHKLHTDNQRRKSYS